MNVDLNRHLDGELPLDGLEGEARGEAEAWERLLGAFRVEGAPREVPPWLETRVMAEIEALPEPGSLKRFFAWFLNPQSVRVSPLMVGVASLALAVVFLVGREDTGPVSPTLGLVGSDATPAGLGGDPAAPLIFVQFALEAPGANSVAVGGDFDGWEGSHILSDPDGDGVWTGRIPVKPGVHAYMFLVDGSNWTTDPRADRYAEDGFGNRNAILAVAVPTA